MEPVQSLFALNVNKHLYHHQLSNSTLVLTQATNLSSATSAPNRSGLFSHIFEIIVAIFFGHLMR